MKRSLLLFVPALSASTVVLAQAPTETPDLEPPAAAVQSITAPELGGHLNFLASDVMRGREAGSPEAKIAAEYLASHLKAIGAVPLGDPERGRRSYFQKFWLEAATPSSEGAELTLTLDLDGASRTISCKLGTDYMYGPQGVVAGEVEAPAVFVGYGRVQPDRNIDDYAGRPDVKNRYVLAYRGLPDGRPGNDFFSSQAKSQTAREKGALGLILIDPPGASPARPALPATPAELGFDRPRVTLGPAPSELPVIALADPIRDVLVASLGLSGPDVSPPRKDAAGDLRVRFVHAATREPREDRNVVGYLPGSDPEKKKELIVFSAHFDHEGVKNGEIYNGSDDNASGTSGVLEVAQAFGSAARPARSVAFLWVSGEEKGLLGSKWFADHQALPNDWKIVADINMDMISRNDSFKIGATPSPEHKEYNSLVVDAAAATKAEGLEMIFDSDPYFGRTDSFNFASKGVPVIFFFAGLHDDYHKPTDDVEKADLEKAARVARAAFRLGWKAAQAPEPPKKVEGKP